jgi:hypothetical protein
MFFMVGLSVPVNQAGLGRPCGGSAFPACGSVFLVRATRELK